MTDQPADKRSQPYSYYVLGVMTLAYLVAYLDRQVLAILATPIKLEFGLSDSDLGLLIGLSFAIVYSVLGMPLAFVGDRFNRRNLVAASVFVFSLMTLLSGYATQFWHLVVARFGVGLGQAGTSPSINSILADYFPPQKRATAFAIYAAGATLGFLTLSLGGAIAASHGWRSAMIFCGIPGLFLAVVMYLTVREPVRGAYDPPKPAKSAGDEKAPSFLQTVKFLFGSRTYRDINIGMAVLSAGAYANNTFIVAFLNRSHDLSVQEGALVFALLYGLGGAVGSMAAGMTADRLARKAIRRSLYVPLAVMLMQVPFVPIYLLSGNLVLALAAGTVPGILIAAHVGPVYAVVQGVSPLRMRAMAMAIFLFIANIVGFGAGPLLVGAFSDALQPTFGQDSLRYALLTFVPVLLFSAYYFWRTSRTLEADMARAAAV